MNVLLSFFSLFFRLVLALSIASFRIASGEKSIHSSGISARRNMSNLAVKAEIESDQRTQKEMNELFSRTHKVTAH